jgi:hypothetical protein
VLRRFLSALGYEPRRKPEPESVRHLKRLAEQLNEKAARFRTVAARAVMLEQRIEFLETDSRTWEQHARATVGRSDLHAEASRVCGRIEGQIRETRAELAALHADESHLRSLLTSERARFASLLGQARELGHEVDGCLLYVDLTRPVCPADETLLADDGDLEFVARVIGSTGIH